MFCVNCGKEIEEKMVFCPQCWRKNDNANSAMVDTVAKGDIVVNRDTEVLLLSCICILLRMYFLMMILFILIHWEQIGRLIERIIHMLKF